MFFFFSVSFSKAQEKALDLSKLVSDADQIAEVADEGSGQVASLGPGVILAGAGIGGLVLVTQVAPRMLRAQVRSKLKNYQRLEALFESCVVAKKQKNLKRRVLKAESELTRAKYRKLQGGHWLLYLTPTLMILGGSGQMYLASNNTNPENFYHELKENFVDLELVDRFFSDYSKNRNFEIERRRQRNEERDAAIEKASEDAWKKTREEKIIAEKQAKLNALKKEREDLKNYNPSKIDEALFSDP